MSDNKMYAVIWACVATMSIATVLGITIVKYAEVRYSKCVEKQP